MSELLQQGVWLSLAGMGLTFAALGLLILAIVLLERIFRSRPLVPAEREIKETPVVSTLTRDTADEEVVAAISVALAYLRSLEICRIELGASLEEGPGPWWHTGQAQRYSAAGGPPVKRKATHRQESESS